MAYSAVPTVTTGDTWSAANHNTYIRDNFAAGVPDIFTAAGDLAYASAANAAAPLAIGSAGLPLVSNGSLPIWGSFIYKRQGGSDVDWNTKNVGSTDISSSDNYTPSNSILQAGVLASTCLNGETSTSVVLTFPMPFAAVPIVIPMFYHTNAFNGSLPQCSATSVSESFCLLNTYYSQAQSGDKANAVIWLAMGPI
jgi:hypothetical protein